MEIRSHGHQVKMARGGKLAKTYQEDGRSVKIGSGLKGIQHAKSCLVLAPPQAYMVVVVKLDILPDASTRSGKAWCRAGLRAGAGVTVPTSLCFFVLACVYSCFTTLVLAQVNRAFI